MKYLTLLMLIFPSISLAQTVNDETELTKPVLQLFDAMRDHDGDKLSSQFTSSALLQRATVSGAIKSTDIQKFATSISNAEKELNEVLLSVEVQSQGNLASVWTPYVFYVDQKVSHCGVNSFQLVETKDGWKIQYLIDNVYQGDCQSFINKYSGR
jgi:hypothetical protein